MRGDVAHHKSAVVRFAFPIFREKHRLHGYVKVVSEKSGRGKIALDQIHVDEW